ncbi:pentapeptide repeat-containing protein [Eubacteriales bacterium OttesenSCG-928-N13]|nr:pentapeptide repeat-containing protein [Eubacteriales bacterium OttesenSCG-928-N13]
MAIKPPTIEPYLDKPIDPILAIERAIESSDDLENLLFEDADLLGITTRRLEFTGCRFVRCSFVDFDVKRLSFTDCQFDHCDFSNFEFSGCSLVRVAFEDCRLTGATFLDASLMHVQFQSCMLTYIAFGRSTLKQTRFAQCDMTNASFRSVKHDLPKLESCKLIASEWVETPLKGMDLSDCEIAGLLVSDGAWRGAILDASQLLELARLMGVVVK